jgi:hypothetical protein
VKRDTLRPLKPQAPAALPHDFGHRDGTLFRQPIDRSVRAEFGVRCSTFLLLHNLPRAPNKVVGERGEGGGGRMSN